MFIYLVNILCLHFKGANHQFGQYQQRFSLSAKRNYKNIIQKITDQSDTEANKILTITTRNIMNPFNNNNSLYTMKNLHSIEKSIMVENQNQQNDGMSNNMNQINQNRDHSNLISNPYQLQSQPQPQCQSRSLSLQQLKQLQKTSIPQLLQQHWNNPHPNTSQILLAKARCQSIDHTCVKAVLQLWRKGHGQYQSQYYENSRNTSPSLEWLRVLQRFAQRDFELVFACCIADTNNCTRNDSLELYEVLLQEIGRQGSPDHHAMMQEIVQRLLDQEDKESRQGGRFQASLSQSPATFINSQRQINPAVWNIYAKYLKQWTEQLPSRTHRLLANIQNRLKGGVYGQIHHQQFDHQHDREPLYNCLLNQDQLLTFIRYLCDIIKIQEQTHTRKLSLIKRLYQQDILFTIRFLKYQLCENGLISKAAIRLNVLRTVGINNSGANGNGSGNGSVSHTLLCNNPHSQPQLEQILLFFISTFRVQVLQQIFSQPEHLQPLVKSLSMTQIIDYSLYSCENFPQLIQLQSSLIFHIASDEFASLMQQTLSLMALRIPGFLGIFLEVCMFRLKNVSQDKPRYSLTSMSIATQQQQHSQQHSRLDIILKLCILSKQIIEKQVFADSIRQLVDCLVAGVNTVSNDILNNCSEPNPTSLMMQIKSIQLMHHFREILPEKYFQSYHEVIFKILKRPVWESSKFQSFTQKHQQNYGQNAMCYLQALSILQEQTQYNGVCEDVDGGQYAGHTRQDYQETQTIKSKNNSKTEDISVVSATTAHHHKIRNNKIHNKTVINSLVRSNIIWITEKLLEVIDIQNQRRSGSGLGLDAHNDNNITISTHQLYNILLNILQHYPAVSQRNYLNVIKMLAFWFLKELQHQERKESNKPPQLSQSCYKILQCIISTMKGMDQDGYMDVEQALSPILALLAQPQYRRHIIEDLTTMLVKLVNVSKSITPQINMAIVNLLTTMIKDINQAQSITQSSQLFEKLIKLISRQCIVKSVIQGGWQGLVELMGRVIKQYLYWGRLSNYFEVCKAVWVEHIYLIQMFVQRYEEVIGLVLGTGIDQRVEIEGSLGDNNQCQSGQTQAKYALQNELKNQLQQFYQPTEQICQLLLTLVHINPKMGDNILSGMISMILNSPSSQIQFQLKYTANLIRIAFADFLSWSLQKRATKLQDNSLEDTNDQIFILVQKYKHFRELLQNFHNQFCSIDSTEFRALPFAKINSVTYMADSLQRLLKEKVIDLACLNYLRNRCLDVLIM